MLNKNGICTVLILGGCAANAQAPDVIVTALTSEAINNTPILGITIGGWVTLALAIGAVCIAVKRLSQLVRSIVGFFRG